MDQVTVLDKGVCMLEVVGDARQNCLHNNKTYWGCAPPHCPSSRLSADHQQEAKQGHL